MSNAKDLMRLGGLWTNTDRNGKKYLTGRLSADVRILIFKNEFRTEEKHPTHIMYLAPVERQEDAGRPQQQEEDDFLVDDLPSEPAPAPAPAPRASAPAARPAAAPRPAAGGRPAAAPSRPAPRRPEPADDFEELEDPFAE